MKREPSGVSVCQVSDSPTTSCVKKVHIVIVAQKHSHHSTCAADILLYKLFLTQLVFVQILEEWLKKVTFTNEMETFLKVISGNQTNNSFYKYEIN